MNINKGRSKFNLTDGIHTLVWIVVFIVVVYLIGIVIPDLVGNCSISMSSACFH